MRPLFQLFLIVTAVMLLADSAGAQGANGEDLPSYPNPAPMEPMSRPPVQMSARAVITGTQDQTSSPPGGTPLTVEPEGPLQGPARRLEEESGFRQEVEHLRTQLADAQATDQPDENLKKQVLLLQKQIEVQQKMIELLVENMKKQPQSGAAVEQLQTQAATLESRSVQAARRDSELANSVDDLREHVDAQERYGPQLPAPLKELFLPSGNNETPLSIYGALAFGYSKIENTPGGFYFGEFTPDFFLKLNDWIFLEAEIGIGSDGSVSAGSFAQADFFVNDWLTIIAGRFVAPIGWFNERLNNPWINKLPAMHRAAGLCCGSKSCRPCRLLGVQAQGSFYLGCSPLKMEYAAYVSNGLNLTPATAGKPDHRRAGQPREHDGHLHHHHE